MIEVRINGRPMQVEAGSLLLPALERAGVHIPHLCHDARFAPTAVCRLCVVELDGHPHPVPACTTRLSPGMSIDTHTPALEARRRTLLEWLARKYPADGAEDRGDNTFLREVRAYGLEHVLGSTPSAQPVDDSHPYIRVDMARCVQCHRCERICAEVQGQFTWRIWNRGADTRFVPDSGTTLRASSCVSCGACADTCPSGALSDKTALARGAGAAVDAHDLPVLRRRLRDARWARAIGSSCRCVLRSTRRSTRATCA